MITVTIEKIKNGYIKTTTDTNLNGLGIDGGEVEVFESKRTKEESLRLLNSIAFDLGLNMNDIVISLTKPLKFNAKFDEEMEDDFEFFQQEFLPEFLPEKKKRKTRVNKPKE